MNDALDSSLIGKTDPTPVEVLYEDTASDIMLVCEHAGRAIPQSLGTLGISDEVGGILAPKWWRENWQICSRRHL